MDRSRTFVALAFCLSLATPIFGQENRPPTPSGPTVAPPGRVPYIPVVPPPLPGSFPPSDTRPGLGPYSSTVPIATIPPSPSGSMIPPLPPGAAQPYRGEHYAIESKVELNDGTTLAGEIHSDGPLQCIALFGPAAIRWDIIKGIEWRTVSDEQGGQERKATLILLNGDALTVSVTIPAIQLKTGWGEAKVELSHVRSILMTIEKVKWADAPDGRRVLVPTGDAPDTKEL